MLEVLMNAITWIINFLIRLVGGALGIIVSLLPNSPFKSSIEYLKGLEVYEFLGYIAWLLPIKQMLILTSAWVACIIVYFLYSVAMRWFKLIE